MSQPMRNSDTSVGSIPSLASHAWQSVWRPNEMQQREWLGAEALHVGFADRTHPLRTADEHRGKAKGEFDFTDVWYPIQVKQKDKTGSPDIRDFEGVMTTHERTKGFFISFDYSADALQEIDHFFRTTGKVIVPLTVREILEERIAQKLA